jgi:hypothetical protein
VFFTQSSCGCHQIVTNHLYTPFKIQKEKKEKKDETISEAVGSSGPVVDGRRG